MPHWKVGGRAAVPTRKICAPGPGHRGRITFFFAQLPSRAHGWPPGCTHFTAWQCPGHAMEFMNRISLLQYIEILPFWCLLSIISSLK